LTFALFFLCLAYFLVGLEVFYLGYVKNLYTIQYNTMHALQSRAYLGVIAIGFLSDIRLQKVP